MITFFHLSLIKVLVMQFTLTTFLISLIIFVLHFTQLFQTQCHNSFSKNHEILYLVNTGPIPSVYVCLQ